MRVVEDPLGIAIERVNVSSQRVREPPDRDAADPVRSFRILVLPRDVVLRTRRQHLDVMPGRQPFGYQPAVILRPPKNLSSVPLDDERDLQ